MLSQKQKEAIRLMFELPDEEVAAQIGVTPDKIAKWRDKPQFRAAMENEAQAVRSAAARIASDASLEAARNLHKLLSEGKDGKLSLDTLKASGAFDEKAEAQEEPPVDTFRRERANGNIPDD